MTTAVKPQMNLDILKTKVEHQVASRKVAILEPMDVILSLELFHQMDLQARAIILDPWYNKGVGGIRDDYTDFLIKLLNLSIKISDHIFLWGFPEIVAMIIDKIPTTMGLVAWLTWYYKNNPSVIRGWRSSQNACLHLSRPNAALYPEHFLNAAQLDLKAHGKLRYMPGPTSVLEEDLPTQSTFLVDEQRIQSDVIEEPLLVGFVGKKEQTGHPAQKPVKVIEKLILMTTKPGDLVIDPMAGSGTTGLAATKNQRTAILCDHSDEYTRIIEKRLDSSRISINSDEAQ